MYCVIKALIISAVMLSLSSCSVLPKEKHRDMLITKAHNYCSNRDGVSYATMHKAFVPYVRVICNNGDTGMIRLNYYIPNRNRERFERKR